jgi:hypothetical protein
VEIPERIESWLASEDRLAEIRHSNGDYFDQVMDPGRLGAYIMRKVEALEPRRVDVNTRSAAPGSP